MKATGYNMQREIDTKSCQRELEAQNDFFRIVIDSMNDAVTIIDVKNFQIVDANRAFLNLLNLKKEEAVGRTCYELTHHRTEPCDSESCPVARTAAKKHLYVSEHVHYYGDSPETYYVEVTATPILDQKGEIVQIVHVSKDISERKWMEESLKASEEYFRSFIESSQDCICNLTVEGKVMSINSAGSAIDESGAPEEIIGRDFASCVVKNREAVEEALEKAAGGGNASVQYKTLSKKGGERWWDSRFTPVMDLDGSIKSIMMVSRDITQSKKLEESLLDAQNSLIREHEKLNALFKEMQIAKKEWEKTMDCMGEMIILTDREDRVKKFNKALAEFVKTPSENIIDRDWEELMNENELETVTFYSGSIELLHRPSRRWFELNSYPFEDSDLEFSGTVITLHETTEIKNIAQKLEDAYTKLKSTQTQVLQKEKMASIGQLAAGVAHEINNPMGFISSNLGTLGKYINKLSEFISAQGEIIESINSEETSESLKELRKKLKLDYVLQDIGQLIKESLDGADRVKKIVQNLKTFSRVDEAEYKHADVNECIESTLNIVWNELKYKTTVTKEYGELPLLKCYPQQLNQVFMNLLVNAAQAIEKQGEIKIKTWNGDGSINVSISDTGSGIPPDKVHKIFEPFYTTKPVGKGTGLGLSITYDIVKKHNGEIAVDSEIGKGTTFTVKIPVVEGR